MEASAVLRKSLALPQAWALLCGRRVGFTLLLRLHCSPGLDRGTGMVLYLCLASPLIQCGGGNWQRYWHAVWKVRANGHMYVIPLPSILCLAELTCVIIGPDSKYTFLCIQVSIMLKKYCGSTSGFLSPSRGGAYTLNAVRIVCTACPCPPKCKLLSYLCISLAAWQHHML